MTICPILVIGSLNMDLVAKVNRLPEKGETLAGQSFATYPGGKGANQAVAAAKLGGKVTMAGSVGNDSFGLELEKALMDSGVFQLQLKRMATSTGTALITVADNGLNTIVVVPGANAATDKNDVNQVLDRFDYPGIMLLQHEIPAETVEYAVLEGKRRGWKVMLNPAPARPISDIALKSVDYLTPNETEAEVLTGLKITSIDEAKKAANILLERGAKAVIITMGDKGALCSLAEEFTFVPAIKVTAVDTTAAGDAFSGALAVAFAEGKRMEAAMRFACSSASLSVTRQGAQPALPTREEVDVFEGRNSN